MPQDRDALWSGMHLADMRPPGMQVGFAVPFVMGVGIAAMGVAATRQRRRGNGVPLAGRRPACTVAMVLFAPDDTVSSHAVNAYSGAGGFSHVALDGCEVGHDGEPVLLDCRPSYGMHRRPWSEYSERPHAMVLFDGDTARADALRRRMVGKAIVRRDESGVVVARAKLADNGPPPKRSKPAKPATPVRRDHEAERARLTAEALP